MFIKQVILLIKNEVWLKTEYFLKQNHDEATLLSLSKWEEQAA